MVLSLWINSLQVVLHVLSGYHNHTVHAQPTVGLQMEEDLMASYELALLTIALQYR